MIYAYALDPKVIMAIISKSSEYQAFREYFRVGSPRSILALPKANTLKSLIKKSSSESGKLINDLSVKRLEAILLSYSTGTGFSITKRVNSHYDGSQEWLWNAVEENKRIPYEAILTERDNMDENMISFGMLNESDDEWATMRADKWDKERTVTVERTPERLVTCLLPMIVNSKYSKFVDPYFGAGSEYSINHKHLFVELFNVLKKYTSHINIKYEVHCKASDEICPAKLFLSRMERFAKSIPCNIMIEVFRWIEKEGGERFHNRYLITDVGVVSLGKGFDHLHGKETDDIAILDANSFQIRSSQYRRESNTFELENGRPYYLKGEKPLD